MSKRHSDAILIQQGACNPCGIANSLVEACRECLKEGVDQRTDPAVRLIVHQLTFLCNTLEIDQGASDTYTKLIEACEKERTIQNVT